MSFYATLVQSLFYHSRKRTSLIGRQSKYGRSTLLSLSFSFSFILSTSTYVLDVGLRVGEQQNTVCGTCFFPKYHQIGWMAEWSKALVSGTSLRARVRIPLQSVLAIGGVLQKSLWYALYSCVQWPLSTRGQDCNTTMK